MSFIVSFQAADTRSEDCLQYEDVKHVIWQPNGAFIESMQSPSVLAHSFSGVF